MKTETKRNKSKKKKKKKSWLKFPWEMRELNQEKNKRQCGETEREDPLPH